MSILLKSLCFMCLCCVGYGSEGLEDGSVLIVYDDGYCKPVMKFLKSEIGTNLKKRNIEIDHKKKRKSNMAIMQEHLERYVLSKEPDAVMLMLGVNDIADTKSLTLNEDVDLKKLKSDLLEMLSVLKSAGIHVYLATPPVVGEDVHQSNPLNDILDAWSNIIREIAQQNELGCVDFRKVCQDYLRKHNSEGAREGCLTKDGYRMNDKGVAILAQELQRCIGFAKQGLGRKLTDAEQIRIYTPPEDRYRQQRIRTAELLDQRLKALFPNIQGPIQPSCKLVTQLGPTNVDASRIINQRGTINIIAIFDMVRNTAIARIEPGFDLLFTDLRKAKVENLYIVTVAGIDKADRSAERNVFFREMNEMLRSLAKKHEVGVIDMEKLFNESVGEQQGFYEKSRNERHAILMEIYKKELVALTGLSDQQ